MDKDMVIKEILCAMAPELDSQQLVRLENVMIEKLHGMKLEEECTELSTYTDDNDHILKLFAANKKLQNLSDKSIEQYVRTNRNMMMELDKNYKDIKTDDIKYYLAMYQSKRKVSPTTLCNMKRFISSFFGWLTEEDYIAKNPASRIKNIKQIKKEKQYLTEEEIAKIKDKCKTSREIALVDFLLSIGCRVSELTLLNISDINFEDESLSLYGSKTKTYRTGYLNASAKLHLRNYLMERKDDNEALFVASKGSHERLGNSSIQKELQTIAKRAGIKKHVTVHLFRKTFATRLAAAGVRLEIIKELLGHSCVSVTEKNYVTINQNDVRAAHSRCVA